MKKVVFLFIFSLLLSNSFLLAQKSIRATTDSLLNKLAFTVNDSNRVKILLKLADNYEIINKDSGLIFGKLAIKTAKKINWQNAIATAKNKIGLLYNAKNEAGKALNNFLEAKKIFEFTGNKNGLANVFGNIGVIFHKQKNHQKALLYYQRALEIQREIHNLSKIANNLGNMANIYSHFFDTTKHNTQLKLLLRKKTLQYYNKAKNIYKKIGNTKGIARNILNAGNLFKHDEDKSKAINYYLEAFSLYKNINNQFGWSASAVNIAETYCMVLKDTTDRLTVFNLTNKAEKALIDSVLKYADIANHLSEKIGFTAVRKPVLLILSYVYALKGNHEKAYKTYQKYTGIMVSEYEKNNAAKINKIIADNLAEKHKKQIKIKEMQLEKRQNVTIFLASVLALLILVVFFVFKERKKSERLLLNILPVAIAKRLKKREYPIADQYKNVSIIFIDMAGFTAYSAKNKPEVLVDTLNSIFTEFDALCQKYGLEKIKTIGDCYMAASGAPKARPDHAVLAANMAIDVLNYFNELQQAKATPFNIRIGLHCGPVVAGVIGRNKFIYDLWGDAVNVASRMESTGVVGQIQCTDYFKYNVMLHAQETHQFRFSPRGEIDVKGKGKMQTWLLNAHRQHYSLEEKTMTKSK